MDTVDDEKYATFKRANAISVTDGYVTFKVEDVVPDAVVIRRQDVFASPCLQTYASMIGMVGMHHPDMDVRRELIAIADYFQRQGELAGDEARGLPTL